LQHQIEELDELKILLDAAFKQSNVPMILIHLPDEKIYTINQSALDILGINQDMINEGQASPRFSHTRYSIQIPGRRYQKISIHSYWQPRE
jgi:hypothetical protein